MIGGCCYTCTKYEVLVLWCKLLPLLPNGVIFFHRVSHVFWLEAAGDACARSARAPVRWYFQKIPRTLYEIGTTTRVKFKFTGITV